MSVEQPDISAKDAIIPSLVFVVPFLFIVYLAVISGLSEYRELESCRVESVGELIRGGKTSFDRRTITFDECGPPVGSETIQIHAPTREVLDPPIEGSSYNIRVKVTPFGEVSLVRADLVPG